MHEVRNAPAQLYLLPPDLRDSAETEDCIWRIVVTDGAWTGAVLNASQGRTNTPSSAPRSHQPADDAGVAGVRREQGSFALRVGSRRATYHWRSDALHHGSTNTDLHVCAQQLTMRPCAAAVPCRYCCIGDPGA